MATDLKTYLEAQSGDTQFRPYAFVSEDADALTAYFKPDADFSQRLTDHVTLYRSIDSNQVVGCRIKGIRGILEDLPNFLHVKDQDATLSMVFWSFRGTLDDEARKTFRELAEAAGNMTLEHVA